MTLFTPWIALLPLLGAAESDAPHGAYVEARTASVFAGACHFNGELPTRGREALLAWSFEGGTHAGQPLAGVEVVCAVAADRNLREAEAETRSVLYVDGATPAAREAAVAFLKERHGAFFGEVRHVRTLPIAWEQRDERFAVTVDGILAVTGEPMPDRACCAMPLYVWYEPFVPVEKPLVANNDRFAYRAQDLGLKWSCEGENGGFVGRFRYDTL